MALSFLAYHPERGLLEFDSLDQLTICPAECTVWIDITSKDPEELNKIAAHFKLHELTVEDCLTPGHFPKIDDYGSFTFVILRGLKSWPHPEGEEKLEGDPDEEDNPYTHKVGLYLSDRFVITHHRQEVPWVEALLRQISQSPERTIALGSDALAHRIIDVLIDRFERGLEMLERRIDAYEKKAVEDPDDFQMYELLDMKKDLGVIRQMARAQRLVILKLASDNSTFIDPSRRRYFKDIDDHAVTIINTLDKQIDTIQGVRDAFLAFSNVKLGDTMRFLTVVTTILAMLNVMVGVYGMNFDWMPLLHHPDGFWMVVALLAAMTVLLLLLFRKKQWL